MPRPKTLLPALAAALLAALCATALPVRAQTAADCVSGGPGFAAVDRMLEGTAQAEHLPGLVLGVVQNGRLIHCRTLGFSDLEAKTPVTLDSVFRIASMTKSFTALALLQLRDRGVLTLDDPLERWIPELPKPTLRSEDRGLRVRDLLAHTAGLVTDDPWGDRQLPLPEAGFDALLAAGIARARGPGLAYEYSNYGYALLGRIVTRATGMRYQEYVQRSLLQPLGMSSSGFDPTAADPARRARGYRYEDGAWREEPVLGDGAFASMGGLQTTARDYLRYLTFLLDGWSHDAPSPHAAVLSRASRRELAQPTSYPRLRPADAGDPASCPAALAYSLGMHALSDCRFENAFLHSGGLPGYGSNVLLLPQHGAAVFLFANRTYAPAAATVRRIAARLHDDGLLKSENPAVSVALEAVAAGVAQIYAGGDVRAAKALLAGNLLLDRSADKRNGELRALRERLGDCSGAPEIKPRHALAGTLAFSCRRGTLAVDVLLAPTPAPQLQQVEFSAR